MMEIKDLVQQLYNNRKMTTDAEFELFHGAIQTLANYQMPNELIPQALKVFDDTTEMSDVMWGLVHIVDRFDSEAYIYILVRDTPELSLHASEWLPILYARSLNNAGYRSILKRILQENPNWLTEPLQAVFDEFKESSPKQFEEKLREVLGK